MLLSHFFMWAPRDLYFRGCKAVTRRLGKEVYLLVRICEVVRNFFSQLHANFHDAEPNLTLDCQPSRHGDFHEGKGNT